MQKLTRFSEGVRESLRRLSHITWMAEELHQVADYLMPNNSVSNIIEKLFNKLLKII